MVIHRHARLPLLLAGSLFLVARSPAQQATSDPAPPPTETAATPREEAALTPAGVQARIDSLQGSDLEQAIKDSLVKRYQEALELLQGAARNQQQRDNFHAAIDSAPKETEHLKSELQGLPEAEAVDPRITDDSEALAKEVDSRRAALAELGTQLSDAHSRLETLSGRPVAIGSRLPEAKSELSELRASLGASAPGNQMSPRDLAERTVAEARQLSLQAEIASLEQEQLSQSPRENLLRARVQLLEARQKLKQSTLQQLESRLQQARLDDAERLALELRALRDEIESDPSPDLVARLDELDSLSRDVARTTAQLEEANRTEDELSQRIDSLKKAYRRIREEIELGGLEGSFAEVMLEQSRRLPTAQAINAEIAERRDELRDLRLAEFRLQAELEHQKELEQQAEPGSTASRLAELRRQLLDRLRDNYQSLVRELGRIDADQRAFRDLVTEVRSYLRERIFWERSSPPVNAGFFRQLPAALRWLTAPDHLASVPLAARELLATRPVASGGALLLIALLGLCLPRLRRSITQSGTRLRKISSDRYVHTLRGLLFSILLAAPLPLLLLLASWALLRFGDRAGWAAGLGMGCLWSALLLAWALPLRELCRPGGLGIEHFGWGRRLSTMLRRALGHSLAIYLPMVLVSATTLYAEQVAHFNSLGRLVFVIAHLGLAWILFRLLNPSHGMFSERLEQLPSGFLSRTRFLWFPLFSSVPLILVGLAVSGFFFTALFLGFEFQGTMRIVTLGVVGYGLALRWFMIKERRLALEEAIAERKARREAARNRGEEPPGGELLSVDEENLELDLEKVGVQTRRMLRSVIGAAVIVAIWLLWSDTLPSNPNAGAKGVGGGPGLVEFLQVLLTIGVATTVVRNLPGLLDLAGLRNSGLESGTRYAVATIAQYLVSAAAIAFILRTLNVDWSQFGWIAAALSVGLGFGLQEIVANFVCGIILLFERPIRVGDVVTLGEVTGSVTRIRMRATTITNWDRQEYVVPNKEFITGSLINWTLTSALNRVTIPVGVAYGSDTARAMGILRDLCGEHPLILDDPAPIVSFEGFGDSTLDLVLRFYLPDLDNRLGTITEMHERIDHRFREAGIEISFPQRDLHLRSIDPAAAGILDRSGRRGDGREA